MKITRIVANIEAQDFSKASHFYGEILGLHPLMDMGFITTYGSREKMDTQVSFLDLSIEVDDLDDALNSYKRSRNSN